MSVENKLLHIFLLIFSAQSCKANITQASFCEQIYTLACFKLDLANWLDNFGATSEEVPIVPGVSFYLNHVKVKLHHSDYEAARAHPVETADEYLKEKLEQFLKTHSIKINLWDLVGQNSAAEGAREDKDKRGTGVILAAVAVMASVFVALGMAGITALAGKALITGVVSFVLAIVIGAKELASKGQAHMHYAALPVPEGWASYGGHARAVTLDAEGNINEVNIDRL